MAKLTDQHKRLLRQIRSDRTRPAIESDDWEVFLDLADERLVEDLGGGYAKITPAGRRALQDREP